MSPYSDFCVRFRYCKCDYPKAELRICDFGNCKVWICLRCYGVVSVERGKCFNPYNP